uniref:Secreted protein n=1 Tax=Heterorhabditis bacteriophora TaxID=37862 RepID=A0A1I7XC30_HETBA
MLKVLSVRSLEFSNFLIKIWSCLELLCRLQYTNIGVSKELRESTCQCCRFWYVLIYSKKCDVFSDNIAVSNVNIAPCLDEGQDTDCGLNGFSLVILRKRYIFIYIYIYIYI